MRSKVSLGMRGSMTSGMGPAVLAAATATGFASTADIPDRTTDVAGAGLVNVR